VYEVSGYCNWTALYKAEIGTSMIYLQNWLLMLSNYYKLHQNPVGVQVFSKFSELPIL
jgi:hypothetical protein